MPPLNRDSGAGARRRLEDVSHFFLDTDRAEPPNAISGVTLNSCLAPRERSNGRARIVHLVSVAHDIPGAMVVAGLAALSARSGMRVLVAEATEHPFDAAFALGVFRADPAHRRPIAETRSGVGVLAAPLVGSTLPPIYLQPDDLRAVQDRLRVADLVFVHLGRGEVARVQPEIAPPDELVVVVPDAGPDAQLDAYRAIKEVVRWNHGVRIGMIVAGSSLARRKIVDSRPVIGRPLSRLTEAVERFLRRDCSVIGRVPDAATLAVHFLSGAFLDAGGDEIARVLGPIAGRWMRPNGNQRSSVTLDGSQRSSVARDGSPERTRSPSAAREATIFRHARIDMEGLTAAAHPSGLAGAFSSPRRRPGIQDGRDPAAGNPSPSRSRGPAPA